MLFVEKVQHAEAERDSAEGAVRLLSGWRAQTETWFATAVRRAARLGHFGAVRRSAIRGRSLTPAPPPRRATRCRKAPGRLGRRRGGAANELAAAHKGIGETAKAHAAALAEAAAREVALEIEKAKLEDDGGDAGGAARRARELGRQAAAFKQMQRECGTLRARDEVSRAQLELGASAAQGRSSARGQRVAAQGEGRAAPRRQEAKQLAEEHSRLEKELHLSSRLRARARRGRRRARGLLEARPSSDRRGVWSRCGEQGPRAAVGTHRTRPPTAPSTVERLGAPSI